MRCNVGCLQNIIGVDYKQFLIVLINIATKEKHEKRVMLAKRNLAEAEDVASTNNLDDTPMAYEKLEGIIKRL